MAGEQNMRQRVVKALKPIDAISVENSAYPGTPDVNTTRCWLELKCEKSWPKLKKTPLRVPHFTQQQRVWLLRRCQKGGRAYLLLQVANDWLLFDGECAASGLGTWTRQQCIEHATAVWLNGLNEKELLYHASK